MDSLLGMPWRFRFSGWCCIVNNIVVNINLFGCDDFYFAWNSLSKLGFDFTYQKKGLSIEN